MRRMLAAASLVLLLGCGSSGPTAPVAPSPTATPAATECTALPPQSRTDLAYDLGASYSTVEVRFLVGPDAGYCAAAGFTDGRLYCPLRVQGGTACELTRIGIAEDTRQPGPTWTLTRADGPVTFCTGPASGCEHTSDPFQVRGYVSGVYRACLADASSCAWVTVQRP